MNLFKKFFRISIIVAGLLFISPLAHFTIDAQKGEKFFTSNDSTVSMTVIFAGDAMVHSGQFNSAYIDSLNAYNFNPVFQYIQPILSEGDLKVVNMETTFGGTPYTGFPNFSSPDTFAYALKEAGFNYFALANNHTVDQGTNGTSRTLDVLKNYGINSTGTYKDSMDRASRYPAIVEYNNIKAALLNYTYGTNGMKASEPLIVNYIDTAVIHKDIDEARRKGAEAVMVYFHWGTEYERQPNAYQKSIADFTLKCGADIIIGSHPHVVQPVELVEFEKDSVLQKKWVVWSMGNFVSNQQDKYTDSGIMVKFSIKKNIYNNKITIANMTYIPYWVYKPTNPLKYFILPVSLSHNDSLLSNMRASDSLAFVTSLKETSDHLKNDSIPLMQYLK